MLSVPREHDLQSLGEIAVLHCSGSRTACSAEICMSAFLFLHITSIHPPSLFNSCSKRRMWCVIWSRKETSGTQVSAQFTPHLPQSQIFFLSKVSSTYVTT